jgi:hypothetical protein
MSWLVVMKLLKKALWNQTVNPQSGQRGVRNLLFF